MRRAPNPISTDPRDDHEASGLRRRSPEAGSARSGRYFMSEPIAAGGMASVHLGVPMDDRTEVRALKRLHPHLMRDEYFARMLLDEARIASCIRHPNVVRTYGAESIDGDTYLVMEYVAGLPLNVIMKRMHPGTVPARIAASIMAGALRGLHAAHHAVDANGNALGIVHRDVSPPNILVGFDGVPRVLDFGVAKAERRIATTRSGEVKGKTAYMAPEQLLANDADVRTDVFAAGIVLWEVLAGAPLFHGKNDAVTMMNVLDGCSAAPSAHAAEIPAGLDAVVMRALSANPQDRFQSALEMAKALDAVFRSNPVSTGELAEWAGKLDARERPAGIVASSMTRPSARIAFETPAPAPFPAPAPIAVRSHRKTWLLVEALVVFVLAAFAGLQLGGRLAIRR